MLLTGVILSVETNAEKKIEAQKRLREELELELEKFRRYCSAQEKEIEMLRNELQNHGITIGKSEPLYLLTPFCLLHTSI